MRRARFGAGGANRSLLGSVARTAVIAGTASAVAGRVASHREARKHLQQAQVSEQVNASLAEQQAAGAAPAVPQESPAGGLSAESIARLQQLGDLLKQGILTDDEFAAAKAKVLGA